MRTKHKNFELTGLKTAGLAEGEFTGWASTYGNTDRQGDRVVKGAFTKSIDAMSNGDVVPILWEHRSGDPKAYVGEIKSARETDEGLEITAALDLDSAEGQAAYRQVKARRVKSLSIGYGIRQATKAADGVQELQDLDLMEVSLVARPANDQAVITSSKAAERLVKARKAAAELVADAEEDDPDEDEDDLTLGERMLRALERVTEAANELIAAAEDEGRDLTEGEAAEVEAKHASVTRIKREIEKWASSSAASRRGLQYASDVALGGVKTSTAEFDRRFPIERFETFDAPSSIKSRKGIHKETTTVDHTNADQFLTLGSGRKAAAATIADKMRGGGGSAFTGEAGTKALTSSGQVTTSVPMAPDVIPTGRPATSLLDVIPAVRRDTPTYAYIRQNSRALNAAAVPEGGLKPTSALGVETIEGRVSVVAHLSEPVDKFVLTDQAGLGRFVQDELVYGLDRAIEGQVLNGDGTGANQTGILPTSGVQVQAFDTSALVALRKAMTKAEALGHELGAVVMRPEDWETIELTATSDDAVAFRGVPIDLLERKVWGLRVVLSTALPAKTAIALDPSAVAIDVLGGVDIEWSSESGELFQRNQLQARVEARIGVSVYAPAAIYKVSTAA